jgi:hypothetical protein
MTDTYSTEPAGNGAAPSSNGAAPAAQPGGGSQFYGSQPAQPWFSAAAGFTDEDKAYIANKGWNQGPENIYKSYRDLERVMGDKANAVLLPRPSDPEGIKSFFQKHFGAPENPDGYKLPEIPAEQMHLNDASVGMLRNLASAASATPEQFNNAVMAYNEALGKAAEADVDRFNGEVQQVRQRLEQEMGQQYAENVARGNLAMRKLGINADEVTAISEAIGIERATRLLMNMGGTLAQDRAVGMDGKGTQQTFLTDKAQAIEKIGQINRGDNPNFKKALLDKSNPDHANVNAQWREWQRLANS